MSNALKGQHYCKNHQGNHSHYAKHNCDLCKALERIDKAQERCQTLIQESDDREDGVIWIQDALSGKEST